MAKNGATGNGRTGAVTQPLPGAESNDWAVDQARHIDRPLRRGEEERRLLQGCPACQGPVGIERGRSVGLNAGGHGYRGGGGHVNCAAGAGVR